MIYLKHDCGVIVMNKDREQIYEEAKKAEGVITTKEIQELGIGRYKIKDLVSEGFLVKESKGIYSISEEAPDEYVTLQKRSSKLVYSYGTALFFQGLSDRVPRIIDVTLPQGYNASRVKKNNPNLRVHYVKAEVLELGSEFVETPQGAKVRVYSKERCICDIIKDQKKIDKQIYTHAIKSFFDGKYNARELIKTAKAIGVEGEVRKYMEVL